MPFDSYTNYNTEAAMEKVNFKSRRPANFINALMLTRPLRFIPVESFFLFNFTFICIFISFFLFNFCRFGVCAACAAETDSKSGLAARAHSARGMLVICPDALTDFSYDSSKNELNKIIDIKVKNSACAVKFKNHYILYSGAEIFSFNEKGVLTAQKKYSTIGSLTADGDAVYLSADGFFICLDEKLDETGKVDLGIAKNAHDMMTHEKTAYLLDNLLIPMYIFKIDITKTAAPVIIDKYLIEGIYSHLFAHCLTADAKGWIIFQSYGHQLGSGFLVNYFDNVDIKKGPYYRDYATSAISVGAPVELPLCRYRVYSVAGGTSPLAIVAETTGENMFMAEIKFVADKDGKIEKTASISNGFKYEPGCGFEIDFKNLIPLSPAFKNNPADISSYNGKTIKISGGKIFHCVDSASMRIIDFSSGTAINEAVITYKEPLSSNPVDLIFY